MLNVKGKALHDLSQSGMWSLLLSENGTARTSPPPNINKTSIAESENNIAQEGW
jgi:hypothetical protein